MSFNLENKIQFKNLAPSLQALINSKANKTDLDALNVKFNAFRDSIYIGPTDPGATGTKIWIDSNEKVVKYCVNNSPWQTAAAGFI